MSDGDQMRLTGIWKEYGERCPHYRSDHEGVGQCLNNERRACEYELGNFCQEWRNILNEWHAEEKDLCQTCFKLRPGDERVAQGKPCEVCAGDGTLASRLREMEKKAV